MTPVVIPQNTPGYWESEFATVAVTCLLTLMNKMGFLGHYIIPDDVIVSLASLVGLYVIMRCSKKMVVANAQAKIGVAQVVASAPIPTIGVDKPEAVEVPPKPTPQAA